MSALSSMPTINDKHSAQQTSHNRPIRSEKVGNTRYLNQVHARRSAADLVDFGDKIANIGYGM